MTLLDIHHGLMTASALVQAIVGIEPPKVGSNDGLGSL